MDSEAFTLPISARAVKYTVVKEEEKKRDMNFTVIYA
jgi:hypothetical protein